MAGAREDITGATPPVEPSLQFELYHENSKQRRHDLEFGRRIHLLNESRDFHRVAARTFKRYPGAQLRRLPPVAADGGPPFERVVVRRRSIRRFDGRPLALADLSRLLFFGNGLTGQLDPAHEGIAQPVRAAPSAGALYPVELYVVVALAQDIAPGTYHYAVDRHGLELLRPGDFCPLLSAATSDAATFAGAAATFVLAGVFGRSRFKYGERGYRFTLLEAGHACQNILLTATALDLGAVAIGGFLDDEINSLLDLDGVDEAAIYLVAVGQPAPRSLPAAESQEALAARLLESLTGPQAVP